MGTSTFCTKYKKVLVFRYNSKREAKVVGKLELHNETLTMTKSNLTLNLTSYFHLYKFVYIIVWRCKTSNVDTLCKSVKHCVECLKIM